MRMYGAWDSFRKAFTGFVSLFGVSYVLLFGASVVFAQTNDKVGNPQGAAFERMLQELHEKSDISVVADAYPNDTYRNRDESWKNMAPDKAVRKIAELSGRDVFVIEGVYVLRAKNWAQVWERQRNRAGAGPSAGEMPVWADTGYVAVSRKEKATDSENITPAREIAVSVRRASCVALAEQLRKQAAFTLEVEPELKERRIHAFSEAISPSTLIGCIGFLINGGPEMALKQSESQKKAERYAAFETSPNFIKKRIRESDKLRNDLKGLLTDDQKTALENGTIVDMPVNGMPENLRQRALDYMTLSAKLNENIVAPPNMSQSSNFAIRFMPTNNGTLWYMLGVKTIDQNGTEYYY